MTAKVYPAVIIIRHLTTMRNDVTGRLSFIDGCVFYGMPIVAGIAGGLSGQLITNEVFNGSASVFGIFVGLLLNVQVAIFGIFIRKVDVSSDPATQVLLDIKYKRRNKVLRELNANLAYLILICCISIALCVVFLGVLRNNPIYTGILIGLYVHILLNMLMTVKRGFILFDAEYEG